MKIPDFHPWEVTPTEAIQIQKELHKKLVLRPPRKPVRLLAAGDVSYNSGDEFQFGALLLFLFPDLILLEKAWAAEKISFPYIPGLLTFREAPILLKAFSQLSQKPDLLLFDGQGIAHPRSMGIAAHLGLILDIPAIGCAKSRLCGVYEDPGSEKGSTATLKENGKRIGTVVRTRTGIKPVFVSPGHKMDFSTSAKVILALCRTYRLPEPLRQAHVFVNRLRTDYKT
jgi:deoxyribonuclease V